MLAVLLEPFVDPGSRTFWGALLVAGLVSLGLAGAHGTLGPASLKAELGRWTSSSSLLDVQLLVGRQLLRGLGLLPGLALTAWVAVRGTLWLDHTLGRPASADWDLGSSGALAVSVAYTLLLFLAWDASRYLLHRAMHEVPALWELHKVHHTATVLTPLTFHRLHPVESGLYMLRGVVVSGPLTAVSFWLFREAAVEVTFLGVHAVGLALNTVSGNLRHSHCWWSWGPVEHWLISPAQHQLHHGRGTDHLNYGTWLAVWDKLGASWAPAVERPALLGVADPNHTNDLVSAWFSPLWRSMQWLAR